MRATDDELTATQRKILALIEAAIIEDGAPPTVRELAAAMGYAAHAGVSKALAALERKGYIQRRGEVTRGIRLLKAEAEPGVPIIGHVAAGSPILALENVDEYLRLPEHFFTKRPDYFLRVRGDSMIEAGILDGDLVAIERCAQAELGQIIVARLGDEATLKRLAGTKSQPILKAENPRYSPIPLTGIAWTVEGRYLGLIRR